MKHLDIFAGGNTLTAGGSVGSPHNCVMPPDPRAIHISTDGSCYKNPGGRSGCAAIVHYPDHLDREDEQIVDFGCEESSNNRMESHRMTDDQLIQEIEAQRSLMIAVATGGPKIQVVNREYMERRGRIAEELRRRGIDDPNPFRDLWAWYGRWTAGDMPSWASRRTHLSEMYLPLVDQIKARPNATGARVFEEPTGWPRVDRGVYEIRRRLEQAQNEEQFQAVGLLCREVLISVAQVVYDPQRHPSEDGIAPSETDAKRMLDAYISAELGGSANEGVRRHAKAALALANDLQHHRTATHQQAALCAEATISVVNIAAIISGRRDPTT